MLCRLLGIATALILAGCGSSGPRVAPLSGTVTMDGKPLPRVYVNFQPVGSPDNPNPGYGSVAVTDERGRFRLKTVDDKDGAVVGLHKVSITLQFAEDLPRTSDTGSPDGASPLPRLGKVKHLPARYNSQSQLTFTVQPGGTDKADFPLDSKPDR